MLTRCLQSLAHLSEPPDEVLVVWQGDDQPTRACAERLRPELPYTLRIVHSREAGIVPAENAALRESRGEVVLMIDDDAQAPPDWLARHLAHYDDPTVGAVGGPAQNHLRDGTLQPERSAEPVGLITPLGRVVGNMYNHPEAWRSRAPREVDHLVGNNLSLRRVAFGSFEQGLRPYWQLFELDACLQVKARGYRVLFDFANVVQHFPAQTVYGDPRAGDPTLPIYNGSYNHAFVLSKHSAPALRPVRLLYQLLVGSVATPGLLATAVATRRHGHPLREARLLLHTTRHRVAGWRAGARQRGSR